MERGRPKKNGQKPMWMFERDTRAIYAYHKARITGEKFVEALKEAVSYVKKTMPGVPCNMTTVKTALAWLRPTSSRTGIVVSEPDPSDSRLTLGLPVKVLLLAAWGEIPVYPRHNAASKR